MKFKKSLLILGICFFCVTPALAEDLSEKLSGHILLQVEDNGEAWYVNPEDNARYFLGRPEDAFSLMRTLGLGIKHEELTNYLNSEFPTKLSGKILLDVEANGEAYYVYPKDLKGYFLGRPEDAFEIMRKKGLGITNENLKKVNRAMDDVLSLIGLTAKDLENMSGSDMMNKIGEASPIKQKEFLSSPMFADSFVSIGSDINQLLLHFAQTETNDEAGTSTYSISPELFSVLSNEYRAQVMETMSLDEQTILISTLSKEEVDSFDEFVQSKLVDLHNQLDEIQGSNADSLNCYCESDIMNCSTFLSRTEAQNYFECCMGAIGSDIHKLDGDNNGIACESY